MDALSNLKTRVAKTPPLKAPSKKVLVTFSPGENKKGTSDAVKVGNLNRAKQVLEMEKEIHQAAIAEGTACVNPNYVERTKDNFSSSQTFYTKGNEATPSTYDEYLIRAHGSAYTTTSTASDGKVSYSNNQVSGSSTKAHYEQAAEHYVNSLHNLSFPSEEATSAYHNKLSDAQKAKIGDAYLNGTKTQREGIEHELATLHAALEGNRTNPSPAAQDNVTEALRRLDNLSEYTFSVKSGSISYPNIQEVEQRITTLKANSNRSEAEKKELTDLELIAKAVKEHRVNLKDAGEIMKHMRQEGAGNISLLEVLQGTKSSSNQNKNVIDGLKQWFEEKWNGKDSNATWWDKTQAIGAGIAGVIGLLWLFNFITGKMSGGGQANANGQETYTKEQVIEILKRFYAQVQQTQAPTGGKAPMQRALPVGGQFSGVG